MKTISLLGAGIVSFFAALGPLRADLNPYATSQRFFRGTGDDPSTHSFVIPLDFQKGVWLDDFGNNASLFGGTVPWFSRTARCVVTNDHLDGAYTLQQNDGFFYYFDYQNPIVAFGNTGGIGGSP